MFSKCNARVPGAVGATLNVSGSHICRKGAKALSTIGPDNPSVQDRAVMNIMIYSSSISDPRLYRW